MKSNNEFNDEFDILRDFKRHIKDDNLAHNIFNSYGTEECIININDIIKVFNVSKDKIDAFKSNFKSDIEDYANYHKEHNLEQFEKAKESLESIYGEFNGFSDKINKYIDNKDFSDSEDEDTESDSEDEDTKSNPKVNRTELEKNLMKSFCFYRLNNEDLNEDNLYILNKSSKKLYNFKPPHNFYGMIDNSDNLILGDPEENISSYYEIKVENGIENIFISGSGLSVLISEAKEEYFDNIKSYTRLILVTSKLASIAIKAARAEYRIKKGIFSF